MGKIEYLPKTGLCPQQSKRITVKIKYEKMENFESSNTYQKISPICSYEEQHGCSQCPCPFFSNAQEELSASDIENSKR